MSKKNTFARLRLVRLYFFWFCCFVLDAMWLIPCLNMILVNDASILPSTWQRPQSTMSRVVQDVQLRWSTRPSLPMPNGMLWLPKKRNRFGLCVRKRNLPLEMQVRRRKQQKRNTKTEERIRGFKQSRQKRCCNFFGWRHANETSSKEEKTRMTSRHGWQRWWKW